MLRKIINKHPVAEFFAKFLVGFAFADIAILCIVGILAILHLI